MRIQRKKKAIAVLLAVSMLAGTGQTGFAEEVFSEESFVSGDEAFLLPASDEEIALEEALEAEREEEQKSGVSEEEETSEESEPAAPENSEPEAAENQEGESCDVSGNSVTVPDEDAVIEYVYQPKDSYTVTFVANNNGQTKTLQYPIDAGTEAVTVADFLNGIGKYGEVLPNMGGFLDPVKGEEILEWKVTRDGANDYYVEDLDNYIISAGGDYVFTALIAKRVADNIYIHVTPQVFYDGIPHVSTSETFTMKRSNDLQLDLFCADDPKAGAGSRYLVFGTDYTLKYRNNTEPSMTMREDGTYERRYTEGDNSSRPAVEITGKGNYKGFSAEVYFDILPHNFSSSWPLAQLSGLKKVYALKGDGKLNAKIDLKATLTWNHWTGKKQMKRTVTLRNGVDYTPRLYRYDEEQDQWVEQENSDPNRINRAGDYLYTLWGKGNYCGVAFDGTDYGEFSDGKIRSIEPCHYEYTGMEEPEESAFQFRVSGDIYRDLANATITIKKAAIRYDGKLHGADDFGLSVTIGKGENKRRLTEGTDFVVQYDGADFKYIYGRQYYKEFRSYLYSTATSSAVYESRIGVANTYRVTISAIEGSDYFGKKTGKKVTIKGIALSKKGFKKARDLVFDGKNQSNGPRVSRAGTKAGLTYFDVDRLSYDSNTGRSNYLEAIAANPAVFGKGSYSYLTDYFNAAPGVYNTTIYPVGGGVDHRTAPQIRYRRKKISLKKAVKKGYVSLQIDPGEYNAGGALPGNITVYFCGAANSNQTLYYNGQRVHTPYTNYMSTSFVTKASKNKKAGDGAMLTLSQSSYFTGSYKFKYSISPKEVSQDEIPVLNADSWYREEGKILTDHLWENRFENGQLVAKVTDGRKGVVGLGNPGVKLFQTYYKNEADRERGKLSLALIKPNQYSLDRESETDNSCDLVVSFTGTPVITGFRETSIPIDGSFSVYDSTAKIVSASVVYRGQTYEFGKESAVTLPYEGRQIRFDRTDGEGVLTVTLSDGTVLTPDDFRVEYGDNISAGKNTGLIKVILRRNEKTGSYAYGGSVEFRFSISNSEQIVL
ncbi:MAG: hypothetical protein K5696_05915 [Lachnospiraceae bacterium]|nr:hypothetical protein [Lachnospiraceae bacterium]